MKQGLLQEIGNGEESRVWLDNWLLSSAPRPPRYHQDAIVDLTLRVSDLIDDQTGTWDHNLVRQLIDEEDVNLVLNTKINLSRADKLIWGFSKNGNIKFYA